MSSKNFPLLGFSLIAGGAIFGLGLLGYNFIKTRGYRVTSWWRTQEKTQSLSGLKFDWHMLGLAYDITKPGGGVDQELFDWARRTFPVVIVEKGNKIVPIAQADHLHVAWVNKRMGVQVG